MKPKYSSLNYYDETTPEGKAWARGYVQCLRDFGIYKDGVQRIGCLEQPIKTIIEEVAGSIGMKAEEL